LKIAMVLFLSGDQIILANPVKTAEDILVNPEPSRLDSKTLPLLAE